MADTDPLSLDLDFIAQTYEASSRTAFEKVEDAFKELVQGLTVAGAPLEGWTVLVDQSTDIAVDRDVWPAVSIYITALQHDPFEEMSMTLHSATVELEFISTDTALGPMSRRNLAAEAHVQRALAADRYLGGRLQSCEEVDTVPAVGNGKDVGSTSLQLATQFFTPRNNWFVLLGPTGVKF